MKKLIFLAILGGFWHLCAEMMADSANETAESSVESTQNALDSANQTKIVESNANPNADSAILPPPSTQIAESNLKFLHNIRFDFLLDNLEDSHALWQPRTISAVSLAPEIGLGIGAYHALWAGLYGVQNMSAKPIISGAKGGFYAYYAFSHSGFSAMMGISPRKKQILRYGRAFFRPDFEFENPNINGAILQYQSPQNHAFKGEAELVLNHFGGDLSKNVDAFYASLGGRFTLYESVIFGADAIMYHIMDTKLLRVSVDDDLYLFDRIAYSANIAWDLRGMSRVREIFEVANVGFALLGDAERKRLHSKQSELANNIGYEFSANLQYKGFGAEWSYYFGAPQMRHFGEFGTEVYNGLPFYQTNFNRINAYYAYQNDFLKASLNFIFYIVNGRLATQQVLSVGFDMDKLWRK
ncbi:hypothetical protein [Helicobacter sp. 23-1045]